MLILQNISTIRFASQTKNYQTLKKQRSFCFKISLSAKMRGKQDRCCDHSTIYFSVLIITKPVSRTALQDSLMVKTFTFLSYCLNILILCVFSIIFLICTSLDITTKFLNSMLLKVENKSQSLYFGENRLRPNRIRSKTDYVCLFSFKIAQ